MMKALTKEEETLKLNLESLNNHGVWGDKNIIMPLFSIEDMVKATKEAPTWVHFGGGNLFRSGIASLQQRMLNGNHSKTGIILVEPYDKEILETVFVPQDNLSLNVTVQGKSMMKEVVASVAEALLWEDLPRLQEIFSAATLQMVTFTMTEKAYILKDSHGKYVTGLEDDFKNGVNHPKHCISLLASLLLTRFHAQALPIALVSLDNSLENGDKLKESVLEIANAWKNNGLVGQAFLDYLEDSKKVSFPLSMVDKMTSYPTVAIGEELGRLGLEDMVPMVTAKGNHIAPYVNSERHMMLMIENKFPNGRPNLEEAGVIFARRPEVSKAEQLKVSSCLSSLHTAAALFASLLGEKTIAKAMERDVILDLLKVLGHVEGLPVAREVRDFDGEAYLTEILTKRLPNEALSDLPERITVDTSKKLAHRYGTTVKAHKRQGSAPRDLAGIPLVVAGWFRYLMAVDDFGNAMTCSPDPMLEELQAALSSVKFGEPDSYQGQLLEYLVDSELFGVNYQRLGLVGKIEGYFVGMLRGEGAVKKTLYEAMIPQKDKIRQYR